MLRCANAAKPSFSSRLLKAQKIAPSPLNHHYPNTLHHSCSPASYDLALLLQITPLIWISVCACLLSSHQLYAHNTYARNIYQRAPTHNHSSNAAYIASRGSKNHPSSFAAAKKKLRKIFAATPTTFYCRCPMSLPKVQLRGCSAVQNYNFYGASETVIEFEHIYPMARLKNKLLAKIAPLMKDACPTLSRKCLTREIPLFAHFESDMMNIRPVIKKLNRLRRSYWFALDVLNAHQLNQNYHKCTFRIQNKRFHLPHHIKGDVARVMFYLSEHYHSWNLLSSEELQAFADWNQKDPLHPSEALILRSIATAQTTTLPFSLNVVPLAPTGR